MARDVASQYAELPLTALLPHTSIDYTRSKDVMGLPPTDHGPLLYLLEVYVDDFIALAIPALQQHLDHVASATMTGIHDVFPAAETITDDPILHKKLEQGEARWANVKEILGMTFDGVEKTIWLSTDKRDALITTLKKWIHLGVHWGGIVFSEFQSTLAKLQHAFLTIPAGCGLLSPFYSLLAVEPRYVFLHCNAPLQRAVADCRTFLRESINTPTKCRNLVAGWPDYVRITDASAHGAGGIIIGENMAVPPTVFPVKWPPEITADVVSDNNPEGQITNSDLEMADLLFLWLVMEDICPNLEHAHVVLFNNNSLMVHWMQRLAAKHSTVAMQLMQVLALRLQFRQASPLIPLHITGVNNAMTDIPSQSFGSEQRWHCTSHAQFLTLFNSTFPLPSQASWTVYQLSSAIRTRVISILQMKDFTADKWRRLPKLGNNIGTVGSHMSHLWEWTHIFTENIIRPLITTTLWICSTSLHRSIRPKKAD